MNRAEKMLYHQIHPLKLATDWLTAFVAAAFFWQHCLILGLLIGFMPSIVASGLLVRWGNLEPLKASAFGSYVEHFMTPIMQVFRFAGCFVFWYAAWLHAPLFAVVGIVIILAAWLRGLW